MLELGEGLLGAGRLGHLQGVVLHSLAQRPGDGGQKDQTDEQIQP